jgi:hypothetical protein
VALEQRCSKGHYYDTAKHTTCPYCGVAGLELDSKTMPKRPGGEASGTQPKDLPLERGADPGATKPFFMEREGIDPPVGWLVCIDGPDRGLDYRIRAENNSIGRDFTMRICIAGDETISREDHAFVIYDPVTNSYTLRPGVARGLAYLNRGPVYESSPLRPFDEIKLGKTTLLFVPLCGDFGGKSFRW